MKLWQRFPAVDVTPEVVSEAVETPTEEAAAE
jgi:hypothetical protein